MAEKLDPRGAANVFASQVLALIALANAMVECGAVNREALIASLVRQMEKMESDGGQASSAVPLAALIKALRYEQSQAMRH